MSTLRVSSIKNASSATGGLDIAADGSVSGALPSPNRNLLYNGAMQVHQRGTSVATTTASGYLTADRWTTENNTLGTWTQTVENDAPSGSGFRKSLRMLCTTSKSPASADMLNVLQWLEGQDVQRIAKGTSSAQQLTLSFWVKSNVTGTYTILLYDSTNNRSVGASYTVSASATWERKTITFPADTTGQIQNDNGIGLGVIFGLAAGSNFTSGTLQTTWGTFVAANRAVGQVNLAAATNNYWQITGVQLEVGDTATGFEFKSFGQELRECQRYYQTISAYRAAGTFFSTTDAIFGTDLPCTMRVAPDFTGPSSLTSAVDDPSVPATRTPTSVAKYGGGSASGITWRAAGMSGATTGRIAVWIGGDIQLSSEL